MTTPAPNQGLRPSQKGGKNQELLSCREARWQGRGKPENSPENLRPLVQLPLKLAGSSPILPTALWQMPGSPGREGEQNLEAHPGETDGLRP